MRISVLSARALRIGHVVLFPTQPSAMQSKGDVSLHREAR